MASELEKPPRTFNADLHTHVDFSAANRWHGMDPRLLAQAIIEKHVDISVAMEHNNAPTSFFTVEAELERLLTIENERNEVERKVLLLLGDEMTVEFDGCIYHVGYIFKKRYGINNFPRMPERIVNVKELENLLKEYPALTVLFHPTIRDERKTPCDVTRAFMESGILDGVELLNGSVFDFLRRCIESRNTSEIGHTMDSLYKAVELYETAKRNMSSDDSKLAAIGSSDAHKPEIVGSMVTRFEGATAEDLFEDVKRAKTQAVCTVNGVIQSKVKSLLGRNGAGKYIRISS